MPVMIKKKLNNRNEAKYETDVLQQPDILSQLLQLIKICRLWKSNEWVGYMNIIPLEMHYLVDSDKLIYNIHVRWPFPYLRPCPYPP